MKHRRPCAAYGGEQLPKYYRHRLNWGQVFSQMALHPPMHQNEQPYQHLQAMGIFESYWQDLPAHMSHLVRRFQYFLRCRW